MSRRSVQTTSRWLLTRRFIAFIGLGVSAGLALGVASSTAGPQAPRVVELSMMVPDVQRSAWDVMIKNFNNVYPDIRLKATFPPSATLRSLLLTQIQAGNAPDLFHLVGGNGASASVWPFARAGHLRNLSGRPWVKRLTPAEKTSVQLGGKTWAYSTTTFWSGMAYNSAVFRALGLRVPKKFADLLSMCRTISAAGKIPIAAGFGQLTGWAPFTNAVTAGPYARYPNWDSLRNAKKVRFAGNPIWRAFLSELVDAKNAGCFSPGALGTSVPAAFTQLVRGEAAMLMVNSINKGSLQAIDPSFTPEWFPLPARAASSTRGVMLAINTLAVNAKSGSPKEATTFVDFLARPSQAALFNKVSGGVSGADVQKCRLKGEIARGYMSYCKANKFVLAPLTTLPNQNMALDWLPRAFTEVFLGKQTIDDVLRGMDYMWDNPGATSPPS